MILLISLTLIDLIIMVNILREVRYNLRFKVVIKYRVLVVQQVLYKGHQTDLYWGEDMLM